LLERSLAVAEPGGVRRPFGRPDHRLGALLQAHAQRGTAFDGFIAAALARQEQRALLTPAPLVELSSREREVLGYLQTGLSSAEIANALFISANTLKTHQRSIYRKLGVASRREAIRAARERIGAP
jgi:LuxR family maltose regulon positive regulatory protein